MNYIEVAQTRGKPHVIGLQSATSVYKRHVTSSQTRASCFEHMEIPYLDGKVTCTKFASMQSMGFIATLARRLSDLCRPINVRSNSIKVGIKHHVDIKVTYLPHTLNALQVSLGYTGTKRTRASEPTTQPETCTRI